MNFRRHRAILFAYLGMIILLLLTSLIAPGFLGVSHLRSLVVLAAFIGIVALGQTFVIIGGGIDLSVPWILNCAAVLMTLAANGQDRPLVWIVPLLLFAGALIGAVNGLGVALFGVPPIIMTRAVNVILQGEHPGPIPAAARRRRRRRRSSISLSGGLGGVPVILLIWVVLAAIATVLLTKTAFGRQLYAVGSSASVAEFSPACRRSVPR